jgi:hypothetical protein
MRRKIEPESDEHRIERIDKEDRRRIEQAAAEEKALDAAVRRSIKTYGA